MALARLVSRPGGRLGLPPSPLQVWAVEDTAVQLTWGHLPPGPVEVEADASGVSALHPGGPGGVVVEGLPPATTVGLRMRWDGGEARLQARTLAPPPGALLARLATVSDLHLGATRFGLLRTMTEPADGRDPHPLRCARAALDEAGRWGAGLVVVKGDLVNHRRPDHFAQAGDLIDAFDRLEMVVVPGNHEVDRDTPMAVPSHLGRRRVPVVRHADHVDLPGLRVIVADTSVEHNRIGTLARVGDEVLARAADAPGPALVLIHHHLPPHRVPTHWPPGIAWTEGRPFLDRLALANPRAVVSSGHSHRNRSRRHGPLVVTEVGSTKDWPGVWAGYAVHEGGIAQVVRRVQAPEAMAWTEYARAAVLGVWGRYAPGRLDQRCFTHRWPG